MNWSRILKNGTGLIALVFSLVFICTNSYKLIGGNSIIFAGLKIEDSIGSFSSNQATPDYFEKLQNEKVNSDPFIVWQQLAPGMSGYCEVVEYHPTDPDCIMMSPDMYNSYGSWDNGNTWHTIKDCDGNGDDLKRMRDFAFSRQNPDFGVALDVRGSLWETHDRGRSWEENVSFNGDFKKGRQSVVEIDPTDSSVIYIGGGDFWNVKFNNRTKDSPHHAYYSVWNGVAYGKIWRSTDGGETWLLKNDGIHSDADIGRIWIHPEKPEILYAATSHGIYKSSNRGNQWVNISKKLPHNMIRDMGVHYDTVSNNLTLYVIDQVFWEDNSKGGIKSTGGVFKSTDDGASWTNINSNLYLDLTKVSSFVTDYYYRQLASWFEISKNEAKLQYPIKPDSILQVFNRLIIDPSDPSRLYLGHNLRHDYSIYPGDLWVTENGGKSWISCTRIGQYWNGDDKDFWTERGNPVNINMDFAHLREEVENDPYPWTGCRALTVSGRGDVTGVFEQQTLQTLDHGKTWNQVDDIETSAGSGRWVGTGSSNLPGRPLLMDPRMPGRYLLMSGEHGLWKMTSGGGKVRPGAQDVRQLTGQIEEGRGALSISSVAVHPHDTSIIYMLMFRQHHAGYLRKSTNGGETWTNISHPVNVSKLKPDDYRKRVHQYSLIIDKEDPDQMYFCVPSWIINDVGSHRPYFDEFGVYHSTDGGHSWERDNKGLPGDYAVNTICFDPSDNSTLYAAVMQSYEGNTDGGLYVSHNYAGSWQPVSIPEEIESVNHVHIDSLTGKIYIACGLRDGNIERGGVWVSPDKGDTWEKIFYMPLVFRVTTALYDSSRIAVTVGPGNAVNKRNPGAYISFDSGDSWVKANKGLGQPDRLKDIKFDLKNPDLLWTALWGSGWYKGKINENVLAEAPNVVADGGENVVLDASASLGNDLQFYWQSPPEVELTEPDQPVTTFTAPGVSKDSTLSFMLFVSNGVSIDSLQVNAYIRPKKYRIQLYFENSVTKEGIDTLQTLFGDKSYMSDHNGKVYVEKADTGTHHLEILSDHFDPLERKINVNKDTVIKFIMNPYEYPITFNVLDAGSEKPVDSATIKIQGQELLTNSSGLADLTISYGEHEFTVKKDGYQNINRVLAVNGEKTVEIEMERVATYTREVKSRKDVQVYPNPADERIIVSGLSPGIELRVIDLHGKTIIEDHAGKNNWRFDVSSLSAGLYFILINNMIPLKFMVK